MTVTNKLKINEKKDRLAEYRKKYMFIRNKIKI